MNEAINRMKAIGIMAVVLGHCCCGTAVELVVSQFHVALFFFVSGFCFKPKYLDDAKSFLANRIKGLYFPYILWGFVFLLLHNVFYKLSLYDDVYGYTDFVSHLYGWKEMCYIALKTLGFSHCEQLLGAYWFLKVSFYSSILSIVWLKTTRNVKHNVLFGIVLFLLLMLIDNYYHFNVRLFHITSQEFVACVLFLVGYSFARYKIEPFQWYICLSSVVLLGIGSFFWPQTLANSFYDNAKIIPYLFTAILFIWSIYTILQKYELPNWILSYLSLIGKNTMVVLTWHFLSFKVISLVIIWIYGLSIERLAEFPVISEYPYFALCYFIVSLIIVTGLIKIRNRWSV